MNKTISVIYPFILIFLWGCSNTSKLREEVVLLESDQYIKLPMDGDTKMYSAAINFFTDNTSGVDYLTIENNTMDNRSLKDNFISFFRMDSCKLSHKVPVYSSGPNAVPKMFGHGVLGLDDIIVSSVVNPTYYKIDRNGNILHTYDYHSDNEGNPFIVSFFSSLIYTPLICNDGRIYTTQNLPVTRYNGDQFGNAFEFDKSPVAISIDTASGEVSVPNMCYPKLFEKSKKIGHNENFSMIYDGSRFVFSFSVLPDIYVSDDLNNARKYPAASRYIGPITFDGYKPSTTIQESSLLANTSACYGNIIYDKYRDVYYRYCFFKDEKKQITSEYRWCRGAFTIMILDKEFNVIGETKFSSGHYAPMIFFVNKEGLWLSENNYERTDMNDDMLVFRCLKLVKQ